MIRRILIVDDEENSRVGLGRLLTIDGYDVITVASARDALERLLCEPVHLVISDLCMPGMNGLDLLREVQNRHPKVPVIMVTAAAEIESYLAAISLGVIDYLSKPIKLEDLRNLMDKLSERVIVSSLELPP